MPIYGYSCAVCKKEFERFFTTISKAAPFINSTKCDCGKKAKRKMDRPPKVFFKDSPDRPYYSDPTVADKD